MMLQFTVDLNRDNLTVNSNLTICKEEGKLPDSGKEG